jgi:hypothetical protein
MARSNFTLAVLAPNFHFPADILIFVLLKPHRMKPALKILAFIAIAGSLSAFQLIKTSLTVTVRDELGNIVEGAKVQLFENEADYTAEKNVAAEGETDKKGIVKLKELKAIPYYVIVKKEDKDNSGGGEQTAKLDENKINKVTIIIQ